MTTRDQRARRRARTLVRDGDEPGAIDLLQRLKRKDVDDHALLGELLAVAGRSEEAVDHLQRAHDARPLAIAIANNLGHALRNAGELDRAEAVFDGLQTHNPREPLGAYGLGTVAMARDDLARAGAHHREALRIAPNLVQAARALADVQERSGEPHAAIQTLTRTLADYGAEVPGIHRHLGLLHALYGSRPVASGLLAEAARRAPADAVVAHMRRALDGETAEPDPAWVSGLFDAFAAGYDHHLVHVLQTRVPELIAGAVGEVGTVLDLGCGTGLAVAALAGQPVATGVDVSSAMVAKARSSGRYRAVHEAGLLDFLDQHDGSWDVAIAADVLGYLGDLRPLLAALRGRVGRFVFTTESHDEPGWAVFPDGRVRHHPDEVREAAVGWTATARAEPLRRDGEGWTAGHLWVLDPTT